ncbi:MAG: nicotinate-nucleotide adenylyltransferase [Bermanella sp.]|jgi:nicotinate-nucleotide adenylyltransferase
MAKIAVAPWDKLDIDGRELERDGPSYTADTLKVVRAEVGSDTSLTFVMGSDAFNTLHQWHRWQSLFEFANILVMQREGYQLSPAAQVLQFVAGRERQPQALIEQAAGAYASIALKPWPQSATEVRGLLAAGRSLDACVPAAVEHYIQQHKLYRH